jgi:hypothetical protein
MGRYSAYGRSSWLDHNASGIDMAFFQCGQSPFKSAIPILHPWPGMLSRPAFTAIPAFVFPAVIHRRAAGVVHDYAYYDIDYGRAGYDCAG